MVRSQDDPDDDITYKRGNVSNTTQSSSRGNQATAGHQTNNDLTDKDRRVKDADAPQRRASFKKNALRERRRSQKKAFDSLMEAVKKSGSSQSFSRLSQDGKKQTRSKSDTVATKIQSFFRGFRSRKKKILKEKESKQELTEKEAKRELKEKVVERIPFPLPRKGRREKAPISDISMDSSFQTLGSIENSPRTNMKRMNEEYYNTINSPTSDTCFEDSFSTVFSTPESTDLPVRLPRRTQSPLRSPSGAMKDRRRATSQNAAVDMYFPPISPSIKGRGLSPKLSPPPPASRTLTMGRSPETETSLSSGLRSRPVPELRSPKSYKSWPPGDIQSLGGLSSPPLWSPEAKNVNNQASDKNSPGIPRRSTVLSFSTGFERDEPAKVPARSKSKSPPIIPDMF